MLFRSNRNFLRKPVPRAHNQLDPRLCAFHMCKRICAFLLCASGYVRTICAFNMCEPYVRLICAFFTNSIFDVFPLSPRGPPGTPQGACRRPPGSPQEPQEKAHTRFICASFPGGPPLGPPVGLLWGPPVGLLWGPPVGTCLAEKEKRHKKVKI